MPQSRTTAYVGDPDRVEAARRVLRADRHPALNRLAELAAELLRAGSAQVSIIAEEQTVVGGAGAAAPAVGTRGRAEDSLCTVTVANGAPLVVCEAPSDTRVRDLPPVSSGAVGSYLGVPLVLASGHTVGALCVFDPLPRVWSAEDERLLAQLARPVAAELELAALASLYEDEHRMWQVAVDAAGIGSFDWDLTTGELRWDDRLLEIFGVSREEFGGSIEAFNEFVHPDDLPRVSRALAEAVASCGDYLAEYRVNLPDGETRWVGARGRAFPGPDGTAVRLVGSAYDITATRDAEAQVVRVLEAIPTAFFHLDPDWRFGYVNAEAERLLGARREDLTGGTIWELFPAALDSEFETRYRGAMESGVAVTFDAYYPPPLDAWYEVRVWPSAEGLSVYFIDVTDRHRAQELLDREARRSALLARVSEELMSTLDAQEAVARLAPLIVPDLGDWCVVSLVRAAGQADWRHRVRDVGSCHADPAMQATLQEYAEVRADSLTDGSYLVRALSTTAPVVMPGDATEAIEAVLTGGRAEELIRTLAPAHAMAIALPGRDDTVGLLTVARGADRPPFAEADLRTIADVAQRAGLALDNARLYAQQRDLAEGLQRSLLTPPPRMDELEIAVRYEPAAQAAQVGGDWYDSFVQEGGATVLVIGDVIGHDTAAAAAMGQMRSLLRAIAVHTGASPAGILHGVDRAMATLDVDSTATAVVVRLEQTDEQRLRGETTVRWSNAGHPPPLLLRASGEIRPLAGESHDLLLGLDATVTRAEASVTLGAGDGVLLFTDGLVERRDQSLGDGLTLLQETLGRLVPKHPDLDVLCDRLLHELLPGEREDDVAMVAVRLREHPGPPR